MRYVWEFFYMKWDIEFNGPMRKYKCRLCKKEFMANFDNKILLLPPLCLQCFRKDNNAQKDQNTVNEILHEFNDALAAKDKLNGSDK